MQLSTVAFDYVAVAKPVAQPAIAAKPLAAEVTDPAGVARHSAPGLAVDHAAGAEPIPQPAIAAEHRNAKVAEPASVARHSGPGVAVNHFARAQRFAQLAFTADIGVTAAAQAAVLPIGLRTSSWL